MRDKIKKYMTLTNSDAAFEQLIAQLVDAFVDGYEHDGDVIPEADRSALGFIESFIREGVVDLSNRFVDVIARYFDETDIDVLIAFYESPVGRKIVAAQPTLLAESAEVSKGWMAEHATEFEAGIRRALKGAAS